jgi:hypothetical protein
MSVAMCKRVGVGLAALALAVGVAGCGKASRTGRSPVYLVITNLQGASGADPTKMSAVLYSDVLTLVKSSGSNTQKVPTIYPDLGQVTFQLSMKDVGQQGNPTAPEPNNAVTLNRFHVEYHRSDGRSTPGVDVPYGFDGAMTFTVAGNDASSGAFELVRIQAKEEAPLIQLAGGGGAIAINTIADVTFYGKDVAGNDVQANGSISVNFSDWADPDK